MLDDLKLIHTRDAHDMLGAVEKQAAVSGVDVSLWRPEIPAAKNQAKQFAQELMGRTVALYSGGMLAPAARHWKATINAYAKQLAWAAEYSTTDHGELLAWTGQPLDKPYAVVEFRSRFDPPEIKRLCDEAGRLLSGRRPEPIVIAAEGTTEAEQVAWIAALGDFTAIYLAILNGVDPAVDPLEQALKKE